MPADFFNGRATGGVSVGTAGPAVKNGGRRRFAGIEISGTAAPFWPHSPTGVLKKKPVIVFEIADICFSVRIGEIRNRVLDEGT